MPERDRRIVTLPYGEGLDRSTGRMVVRPQSFDDLRNVFLFEGKAQARQGLAQASTLQDDGPSDLDVTLLLEPLRSESAAMGVGFDSTSKEVWLNRMLIDGTSPVAAGLLGTLDPSATFDPPIIVAADSDNKLFIAHDEPNPTARLVTQIYDPMSFPTLSNLTADLDGNGKADVFFRGVVRHLSYIFGWGYGSASDPVRGDVVRVSESGNSAVFEDFAFFEAGQQGETVMVCRSAGPTLMVFKETETYEIFGYSPDTFGIRLADSLFGCVGSRLAVSVAGNVFFWSTQGPRFTSGGPSQDIAVPLDIDGPDPATLVAESEPQDAFATYDPRTRVVQFVWGRRVYALSIRNPNRPRWSYYELAETAQCAGLFFDTQSTAGSGGPPTGAPENLVFDEEARGTLTLTANPSDNETVTIDSRVYTFKTVLTPTDGEILIGATASDTLDHLIEAILPQPGPNSGVDYAATTQHPSMTAAAGPGDTMEASGRLSEGFASNGKPLLETLAAGSWDTPVTKNGIGQTSTFVGIKFDNVGQIGAEVVEVHVSDDGGASYSFCGDFPADGLAPEPQFITVELQNQATGLAIQPLTDYKFSLRYRLGGQFTTGYTSANPDDWPTDSQGTTETISGTPELIQRVGDNEGVWSRLNEDDSQIAIGTVLPEGHELIDVEVFLEIREAGPETDPDDLAAPFRGTIIQANQLRAVYNAGDPGYPNTFTDGFERDAALPEPQTEKLNNYKMRFRKGSKVGPLFSNTLQCYAGPDSPPGPAITSFSAFFFVTTPLWGMTWVNATTPTDPRTCPPTPPASHPTMIFLRNATAPRDTVWIFHAQPAAFQTSINLQPFNFTVLPGDEIRVAIAHRVSCFGSIFDGFSTQGDWAIANTAGDRYETDTATL